MPELTQEEQQVLKIVNAGAVSVGEISRQIDRSSETVIKLIDALRSKNYEVKLDEDSHQVFITTGLAQEFRPTEFQYHRKYYRIGLATDTHIGSRYQQMTLLYDAWSLFDTLKTDFNVIAGDIHDGIDMYKGHREELFLFNADQQLNYSARHLPKSKRGTKTYVIGGQHDYCYMKQNGYNIVKHLHELREDILYRGMFKAEFKVKGLMIQLQHPGGGVAYARSYKIQKIIESIVGHLASTLVESESKQGILPVAIFFGHWHIGVHLPHYMGVEAAALPCFQAQTTYLQQKGLMPDVGCAIADIGLNENGALGYVNIKFVNMNGQIRKKDY